ncbi:MAG: LemA family protein [uncultured Sphingosinicella sp.]|uniref:LemA family protein n=1 Tax=uncultured Sphingosinicella sp. TaxID=478748 RepID=A0A6J4TJF3_9SPHN|nr:LemA family protein [uncultured Sphingosinicella sp.]CAA9524861.1 MAG: LemA family protein [uncultured Sphingosinicella sp.]
MTAKRFHAALLAPAALLSLSGCGVNTIPTAEEEAKAQWANVQAAFQRRANLIPNLVSTVRGAAASEERILTGVTEARASATRITVTPEQLSDPQAMQRFSEAQSRLAAAIIPLQRLQEAYPQLQSQQNFATLMTQLEGTENRINIDIRDYNDAVRRYNTTIRTFPNVIGARVIYGSQPLVPYQATTAGAEEAPKVDFGNGQ